MKRSIIAVLCAGCAIAQIPNPTQNVPQSENRVTSTGEPVPVFSVTVVQRTTQAVSYRFRSGWTKVDFQGTPLAPEAKGHAEVNSRNGFLEVKADMQKLQQASRFGPEYMTYVLWAITPEGRPNNLGEVRLDGEDGKLDVTTELQSFGLIVTAEPYFGVTTPSDVVVMENVIRPDTVGKFEPMVAKFELLQRGSYTLKAPPASLKPIPTDPKMPPELYQARNAVRIARYAGADRYAADTFKDAERLLNQAEQYSARKERKPTQMTAREAVQKSEDARIIAIRKQDEERLAQERQSAADREAAAKAETDAESRRRAQAEVAANQAQTDRRRAEEERMNAERAKADAMAAAERARLEARTVTDQAAQDRAAAMAAAEQAKLEAKAASDRAAQDRAAAMAAAEQAKLEAKSASDRAAQDRAAADKARMDAEAAQRAALAQQQAAQADAERARQQASEADRMRLKAEQDREQLRQQLLSQLNMVLETRETARGLIVNMSDVLFDTGKYTLKPGAREKLSKIAGIVIAHPGLTLEVEGHTDNVGGDEYNQKLSEQRAKSVQDYLVAQGLNAASVSAKGFGKTQPVVSNDTAVGRQKNRRVEMVVSGDVIGTKIQTLKMQSRPQQ